MSHYEFNVIKGLADASVRRQEILSNNLANIETPNYVRQDLDFGQLLTNLQNNNNPSLDSNKSIVSRAQYQDHANPVSLESEISKLYDNHLRYLILTKSVGHHFEHMKKALEVRGQ
jgi:flagellar basal-body rod protein FlgB